MKKSITLSLVLAASMGLAACGEKAADNSAATTEDAATVEGAADGAMEAAEGAADAAAAAEGAADAAAAAPVAPAQTAGTTLGVSSANAAQPAPAMVAAAPKVVWRDEMPVILTPGEGTEIKLKMAEGAKVQYSWVVEGGAVNFDTHGDAPGKSISYEKGRGVASDEGVLEAAFTGNHGWYWRNRGEANVKVVLRTRGDYTDIKHVK